MQQTQVLSLTVLLMNGLISLLRQDGLKIENKDTISYFIFIS